MRNVLIVAGLFALLSAAPASAQVNARVPDACSLVTAQEVRSALNVWPAFSGGGGACVHETAEMRIVVRVARDSTPPGLEARSFGMAEHPGPYVQVQRFGGVICSQSRPPPMRAQDGDYRTICSVMRNRLVAAVEVTMPGPQRLVPVDRVRRLADLMARRMI
ncbi:MAG: hypothetical protein JNJ73_10190 [Hyphomonadaceae bacterium]|nr:hypothetical protein [Hyphomonadaceae bacterium]